MRGKYYLKNKKVIKLYCRKCCGIVESSESYLEEKTFPERNPEFDIATYCCSICNNPIMEITQFQKIKL